MPVALDYLREEAHSPQRAGAIAMSGLAGYIWGMRHCGMFRRLFYATCGAMSMAAICYPKEAYEYADVVAKEGKKYFVVAYHFIWGETPKTPEWLQKISSKIRDGMSSTKDEDKSS